MGSPKRYYAFISYRHADNKEQGRQWATWLHQAIETYEVPVDLVGKTNGRGETIPDSIYPIFRDEEELSCNADLGASIVRALDETRLLIVLCSPKAVASPYVADEIDHFKKQGHSGNTIAAIIDGEPNASWDKEKQSAGFTKEDECFPAPLQFNYDDGGNRTDERAEPLAADFRINNSGRPEQAWTTPEAYRQHLSRNGSLSKKTIDKLLGEYQQKQHLMLLKVIAGILGVPLGELTQRDKKHQLEQARIKTTALRRWLAAVAAFAVVAVVAGCVALKRQQDAIKLTREVQVAQSEAVARVAQVEFDRGDYEQSIQLALSGLPESLTAPDRGYSANAEAILSSAVFHHRLLYTGVGDAEWPDFEALRRDPYQSYINHDEDRLILYGQASPVVIDLNDHTRIKLEGRPAGEHWSTEISSNGRFIGGATRNDGAYTTYVWSVENGRLLLKRNGKLAGFSHDEKYVGVQREDNSGRGDLIEMYSGKEVVAFDGLFKDLDRDGVLLFAEQQSRCTSDGLPARCVDHTCVYAVSNGERLYTMSGEITGTMAHGDMVLLKNSTNTAPQHCHGQEPKFQPTPPEIIGELAQAALRFLHNPTPEEREFNTAKGRASQSNQDINGVALWNMTQRQRIHFYPGEFQLFHASTNRLVTKQWHTKSNQIWNLENGELIASIEGNIVNIARDSDASGSNNIILDAFDDPGFLIQTRDDPASETVRVSLLTGEIKSRSSGQYLGILESGRFVTRDRSLRVFIEYEADPLIDMDGRLCGGGSSFFRTSVLMPNVPSHAVLLNCDDHIYVYYPESHIPGKPQIISSTQSAQWVEDGDLFWFGADNAEFRGFSFWEGGGIEAEQLSFVQAKASSTFRSLAGGNYLLRLTPDSGLQLWESPDSILTPVVKFSEFDLREYYLNQAAPSVRNAPETGLHTKFKNTLSDLGFHAGDLRKIAERSMRREKSPPDYEDDAEVRRGRWLESRQIVSESALSEFQSEYSAYFELEDSRLAVVIGEYDARLIDLSETKNVSHLHSGYPDSEPFFELYEEAAGVSESPAKNGFIFYNPFGMWLFDMQGNLMHTLCGDSKSCDRSIDFKWLDGGQGIFLSGNNPAKYSLATKQLTELCVSLATREDCRNSLRDASLFGENTVAAGSTIFDFKTGIVLVKLPSSLAGGFNFAVSFNSDESAILMAARNGGDSLDFGIWRLPVRGEAVLQQARRGIQNR